MKFLCVPCDSAMKLQTVAPPERGSLSVVYACPECGYEIAMLTNAYETQIVQSLGVRIGPAVDGAASSTAESRCPFSAMIPASEEALPSAQGRDAADDPAQRGRLADGAPRIGAQRGRYDARCDRDRRTAAGSSRSAIERPWISRGAECRILRRRAHRKLVEVGLADNDGTGRLQAMDDGGVIGGDILLEDSRRRRSRQTVRCDVVFECDRHTMQCAQGSPRRSRPIQGVRPGERSRFINGPKGVQGAVEGVRSLEARNGRFASADVAARDPRGEFDD